MKAMIYQVPKLSIQQTAMSTTCDKSIRNRICHTDKTCPNTCNLYSPNTKHPSSVLHTSCVITQPRVARPHQGTTRHIHVSKGLYKPLVSKFSTPGYMIRGVPSPRQSCSLKYRQQCSLPLIYTLMIVGVLLEQFAGAVVALVRTGRLHLPAQIRGNDVCGCLLMIEASQSCVEAEGKILTAYATLPFE